MAIAVAPIAQVPGVDHVVRHCACLPLVNVRLLLALVFRAQLLGVCVPGDAWPVD